MRRMIPQRLMSRLLRKSLNTCDLLKKSHKSDAPGFTDMAGTADGFCGHDGVDNVYTHIAVFFSKMSVLTFGGAYAILSYVAQQAVEHFHWLTPGEMLIGLGMAETTPGPLISVVQFVGFMAAFRDPGVFSPVLAGTLGGILAKWVTFTPSFLFIFIGAPYIEALRNNKALNAVLSTITAAVVGVILNLSVWFALHTLFAQINVVRTLAWSCRYRYCPAWNPGHLRYPVLPCWRCSA
jgi:chromate transport protein ChrA